MAFKSAAHGKKRVKKKDISPLSYDFLARPRFKTSFLGVYLSNGFADTKCILKP